MRLVRCWAALLLGCATCLAQTGVKISPHTSTELILAKAAVRRYCEMDAQGFRLSDATRKRIESLTATPLSAAGRSFDVIQDCEIGAAKANPRGILVSVTYRILGRLETGDGYAADPHVESIEVQTVADGDDWKIVVSDELLTPRIGRSRTLKWLQEQISVEKDPVARRTLEQSIKLLE